MSELTITQKRQTPHSYIIPEPDTPSTNKRSNLLDEAAHEYLAEQEDPEAPPADALPGPPGLAPPSPPAFKFAKRYDNNTRNDTYTSIDGGIKQLRVQYLECLRQYWIAKVEKPEEPTEEDLKGALDACDKSFSG